MSCLWCLTSAASRLSFVIPNCYIVMFHKVKSQTFCCQLEIFVLLISVDIVNYSSCLFLTLCVGRCRQQMTVFLPPGIWKTMMAPLTITRQHAGSSDKRLWTSKSWPCEWEGFLDISYDDVGGGVGGFTHLNALGSVTNLVIFEINFKDLKYVSNIQEKS